MCAEAARVVPDAAVSVLQGGDLGVPHAPVGHAGVDEQDRLTGPVDLVSDACPIVLEHVCHAGQRTGPA
jgi:hypothetical protein